MEGTAMKKTFLVALATIGWFILAPAGDQNLQAYQVRGVVRLCDTGDVAKCGQNIPCPYCPFTAKLKLTTSLPTLNTQQLALFVLQELMQTSSGMALPQVPIRSKPRVKSSAIISTPHPVIALLLSQLPTMT
jgi:hypothetical protein